MGQSIPEGAQAVHSGGDLVYADAQLQIRPWAEHPGGLQVMGEVDAWNTHRLGDALRAGGADWDDLHLDVSRLIFCDVSGIRAFVTIALSLAASRRIVLHGLHPQFHKVIRVVGWAQVPNLVIEQ